MKPVSRIIILAFAIFTSIVNAQAQAQSPREQLSQMVEQLQKAPTDNALREKIIKLAQTLKPAPAVPEEAQRREGRAKFAFKSAKSNDDYLSAAREYEEAVRVAPWVPGYYLDLCTIYEKAEKYVEAKRNCEISMTGLSDPAQVSDVRQRVAGLEYGIENAAKEKNQKELAARAEQEKYGWMLGDWKVVISNNIGFPPGNKMAYAARDGNRVVFKILGFESSGILRATPDSSGGISWEGRSDICPGPGWTAQQTTVTSDKRTIRFDPPVLDGSTCRPDPRIQTYFVLTR